MTESGLQQGFHLGDWIVLPLEGRIAGPTGSTHIEPKVMDVLVCLARRPGAVITRDELLAAVWGGRAVSDEPLTRVIGELRRALGDTRGQRQYILTIPKRGYRLIADVRPVAGGSDYRRETALPTGASQDSSIAESSDQIGHRQLAKRLAVTTTVVAVLAAAAVFTLYVNIVEEPTVGEDSQTLIEASEVPAKSIAVLPFVDLSDGEDNEYFSDGISEQLLNELSQVPGLHVAARTSAFYFKGRGEIVQRIAGELGVKNVLEGSVRKVGKMVRVAAQLVDAETGYQIWAETYDREFGDILEIQDDIANEIVDTLKVRIDPQGLFRSADLGPRGSEAFDIFLRGVALRKSGKPGAHSRAIELYLQAIDIAPSFAAAYKETAFSWLMMAWNNEISFEKAIQSAEPYLETALELKPDSAENLATLALSRSMAKRYAESDRYYKEAIELSPSFFSAHMNYGLSLVYQGRLKEASPAYLRAQALDPLNATLNSNLGALMLLMGQLEEGLKFAEKSISIKPDFAFPKARKALALAEYGRLADAVEYGLEVLPENPRNPMLLGALMRSYIRLEREGQASEYFGRLLEATADDYAKGIASDYFYVSTGNLDGYMEFASKALGEVAGLQTGPLTFTDRVRVHWYGRSLLLQNRDAEAAEWLVLAAGGDDTIAATTYDHVFFLKYLALAYGRLGRQDEARKLLRHARRLVTTAYDNGWATPALFVRLAEIDSLLGDFEAAIKNIRIAVSKGYLDISRLTRSVFFARMQDQPEMLELQGAVMSAIAIEQEKLLATSAEK